MEDPELAAGLRVASQRQQRQGGKQGPPRRKTVVEHASLLSSSGLETTCFKSAS